MCYIANHNYRLIYFNLPLKNLTLKIPPSSTISYQLSYKNTVTAHIGSKTHILDAFVAADIPLEKEIGCMNILMKEVLFQNQILCAMNIYQNYLKSY
ncbi:hypothetical protein GLOIN_2v1761146 [Rhizophagus irregularis DAOM 181602=DAOM 197198]|nr:hypothetical protein GLOIN_2v1761146 [Rhizophagus irregularis DAOM 181602=DAOM 197198]